MVYVMVYVSFSYLFSKTLQEVSSSLYLLLALSLVTLQCHFSSSKANLAGKYYDIIVLFKEGLNLFEAQHL